MHKSLTGRLRILSLVATLVLLGGGVAGAATSNSDSYELSEVQFGNTSNLEGCSDGYCAEVSIGDMSSGSGSSTNYNVQFGELVDDEPSLEVIVQDGESNLGILDTTTTATKVAYVKVRSYLSGGYAMRISGDPPKFGTHTLSTSLVPTLASAGTEQFGINLVANTILGFGQNPVQEPAGDTVFGEVGSNYNSSDMFMYSSGDVVAYSNTDSGQTDYTVSMIVNISNSTPAGHYAGDYSVVVVPVF